MSVEIPHLSLPLRFAGGRAVVTEQGSVEEIADCVEALVRYPAGYRLDAPTFGVGDPSFVQGGGDLAELEDQIDEWEPRARADLDTERDPTELALERVSIHVSGEAPSG